MGNSVFTRLVKMRLSANAIELLESCFRRTKSLNPYGNTLRNRLVTVASFGIYTTLEWHISRQIGIFDFALESSSILGKKLTCT